MGLIAIFKLCPNGFWAPIPMHAHRLKIYNMNMGIIEDGQLVTVSTVRELFQHIMKRENKPYPIPNLSDYGFMILDIDPNFEIS